MHTPGSGFRFVFLSPTRLLALQAKDEIISFSAAPLAPSSELSGAGGEPRAPALPPRELPNLRCGTLLTSPAHFNSICLGNSLCNVSSCLQYSAGLDFPCERKFALMSSKNASPTPKALYI